MSPKQRYHPKIECYQKWNVIKTEMSGNLYITKVDLSEEWNATEVEKSIKLKHHHDWKDIKTEMSQKFLKSFFYVLFKFQCY